MMIDMVVMVFTCNCKYLNFLLKLVTSCRFQLVYNTVDQATQQKEAMIAPHLMKSLTSLWRRRLASVGFVEIWALNLSSIPVDAEGRDFPRRKRAEIFFWV